VRIFKSVVLCDPSLFQSVTVNINNVSYSRFFVMATTPTIIRQGSRIVKPVLSLDKTEARRRVHNLYKLCYRHIPYISKHL